MADQSNTLYIVIDPSGAQRGANASVNAINSIIQTAINLNVTINQINNNLNAFGNGSQQNVAKAKSAFSSLKAEIATIAGVFAGIQVGRVFQGFIDEIIRVDRIYNGFIAMMNVTTGDTRKSAEEFGYVTQMANAYGVSLEKLLPSYSKLRAATRDLMTEQETRKLFQSFTVVSSVLHAESYTVERMYNAIIQMASKGQIHMEELKQQLGEHLPGALAIAAKSMDMKVGDMIKAMEKGEIKARDLLVPLPDELMKRFAAAADVTANSLNAQMEKLKNTIFVMFKDISTNGAALGLASIFSAVNMQLQPTSEAFKAFGEVIGNAFLDVAEFINSLSPEQVRDFAVSIVASTKALIGFVGDIGNVITKIAEYKDELVLLFGLYATGRAVSALFAAQNLILAGSFSVLALAPLTVLAALNVLTAFAAGWMFGTYIREKFAEVEKFGIALAASLTKLPVQISGAWERLKITIPLALATAFQGALNKIFAFITSVRNLGSNVASLLGFDKVAIEPPKFDFTSSMRAELKALGDTTNRELQAIEASYFEMFQEVDKRATNQPQSTVAERLGLTDTSLADAKRLYAELKSDEDEVRRLMGGSTNSTAGKDSGGGASGRLSSEEKGLATLQAKISEAEKLYAIMMLTGMEQVKLNEGDEASLRITQQLNLLKQKDVTDLTPKAQAQRQLAIESLQAQLVAARQLSDQLQQNALLSVNLKLDKELELAKLLPKERERENKLLQIKNELLQQGMTLSEGELSALRERLMEIEDANKASERQEKIQKLIDNLPGGADYDEEYERMKMHAEELQKIWDEAVTPLQRVEAQIYALNSAFAGGALTLEAYNQRLGEFVINTSTMLNELGYGDWQTYLLQSLDQVMEGFVNLAYNTSELVGNAFNSLVDGLSNAVARSIVYGESFGEAMRSVASQVISELISGLIKLGIQFLINKMIADTSLAATVASQSAAAAATASMWSPAAALASLATMGANAGPAAAALTGTAALASTIAVTSSGFAGAFDEGGAIPNGQWGIVGEYGPEIVQGPANVTSRTDTAKMLEYNKDLPSSIESMTQGLTDALTTAIASMDRPESQPPQVNVRNVNVLDPSVVGDYLVTDEGERVIMNVVQRNRAMAY